MSNVRGIIEDVLGEAFIKALKKDRYLDVGKVVFYLETYRTASGFSNGVILAPFSSPKLLKKFIADNRATDMIYVPWCEPELNEYLRENADSKSL